MYHAAERCGTASTEGSFGNSTGRGFYRAYNGKLNRKISKEV